MNINGMFWLPHKKDMLFYGDFRYDSKGGAILDIKGLIPYKKVDYILGKDINGMDISFCDCNQIKLEINGSKRITKFSVKKVYEGIHLK